MFWEKRANAMRAMTANIQRLYKEEPILGGVHEYKGREPNTIGVSGIEWSRSKADANEENRSRQGVVATSGGRKIAGETAQPEIHPRPK